VLGSFFQIGDGTTFGAGSIWNCPYPSFSGAAPQHGEVAEGFLCAYFLSSVGQVWHWGENSARDSQVSASLW